MTIWTNELKELDKLYSSFKGHIPDIVKEMEQLLRTDDANVVMLYSRRCLEVIVTDLCEIELNRPRKTEPLKGIIDKLNSEEKVPGHIITSMLSLNSMATYGTHPKDFDPEQVKPVLNNLAIIIRWYLKYKDFKIVSKSATEEDPTQARIVSDLPEEAPNSKKRQILLNIKAFFGAVALLVAVFGTVGIINFLKDRPRDRNNEKDWEGRTGIFTDPRDGEQYKTIIIGSQVWMAQNLRATLSNDGMPIPIGTTDSVWRNLYTPAYSWYDNDPVTYKEEYGAIYNWHAVSTGKLCPVGWHVASADEWTALANYLGGTEVAGGKMKDASSEYWENPYQKSLEPTNESGFTALPGGFRGCSEDEIQRSFESIGYHASWWSSTEEANENFATRFYIDYLSNSLYREDGFKSAGFYVRCVKDNG